jgi:RNA polymerase sigma-70 factor (ECF subfamily)
MAKSGRVVEAREAKFRSLFESHYYAVHSYVARRVSTNEAVDDVTADVFLALWRRMDDAPVEVLPWLYGVARRALANQRRSVVRRDRLRGKAQALPHHEVPDLADRIVETDEVRSALSRLADADREALMLVAWEQLDVASVAQVLECSEQAARVRLYRARRRLAAILEPDLRAATANAEPALVEE